MNDRGADQTSPGVPPMVRCAASHTGLVRISAAGVKLIGSITLSGGGARENARQAAVLLARAICDLT